VGNGITLKLETVTICEMSAIQPMLSQCYLLEEGAMKKVLPTQENLE